MSRCRVAGLDDVRPGHLMAVEAQGLPIRLARLDNGEVAPLGGKKGSGFGSERGGAGNEKFVLVKSVSTQLSGSS